MSIEVSVIIPCYNTSQYVAKAVQSVFAQTYRDYEVVVVNDGSPDTSELEEALGPWMDRIVYLRTDNHGPAEARNIGIRAAKGSLIAFLDSDDYWHPDYLAVQVEKLKADPAADIVYPNAVILHDGPSSLKPELLSDVMPSRGDVTFESLVNETCTVMVSALMRREALQRVGLLDARLRRCEDLDLWLRCVKAGSRIIYHQVPLVFYRRHADSLSQSHDLMFQARIQVLQKARASMPLTADEAHVVDNCIALAIAQREYAAARMDFASGSLLSCIARLHKANQHFHSRWIEAMAAALTIAPRVVELAYTIRMRCLLALYRAKQLGRTVPVN